jgi:hypothetical protein
MEEDNRKLTDTNMSFKFGIVDARVKMAAAVNTLRIHCPYFKVYEYSGNFPNMLENHEHEFSTQYHAGLHLFNSNYFFLRPSNIPME